MVDHKVHYFYAAHLVAVNEHMPSSGYNESTGSAWVYCDHCGWVGRSYKGRWADKADEQWGVHAADIAMRHEPINGEKHVNCVCSECSRVRRMAAEEARRG